MHAFARCSLLLVALLAAACGKKADEAGTAGGTAAPPVSPDSAVPVPVDAAEPPPDAPAAAAPEPGAAPASVTAADRELADKALATTTALKEELREAGEDCKAAAKVIEKHWKGFVPMEEIRRRINPKQDPAVAAWFEDNYAKPIMRNLGYMVGAGMRCEEDRTFEKALEKQDFAGFKKRK